MLINLQTTGQLAHVDSVSATSATVNTYASLSDYFNTQAPLSTLEITGTGVTYESASVAATAALGDDWVLKAYENNQIIDAPEDLPPPPAPAPRWVEFGSAVMADPEINLMLGAAFQAAPALYGGLSVGVGQAAQGDARVFMGSWATAVAAGLVTPELIALIQGIAAEYSLPAEFIAGLDP